MNESAGVSEKIVNLPLFTRPTVHIVGYQVIQFNYKLFTFFLFTIIIATTNDGIRGFRHDSTPNIYIGMKCNSLEREKRIFSIDSGYLLIVEIVLCIQYGEHLLIECIEKLVHCFGEIDFAAIVVAFEFIEQIRKNV